MATLTDTQAALFKGKNFGALATIRPDGTPHVTPVWVDYDGEHVVFNTVRGNSKEQQMTRNPRVTLTVWSAENPYEYVEVFGRAELSDEGGLEGINALAKKYMDEDVYPWLKPGDRRVNVRLADLEVRGPR